MVSLRNYFTITIVMLTVLIMFQSSGVARELLNDYEENPYVEDMRELPGKSDVCETRQGGKIVYIGTGQSPVGRVTDAWASYSRHDFQSYSSLEQYQRMETAGVVPEMVVINSSDIEWEQSAEIERVETLAELGIHLVFCDLPDAAVIRSSPQLQRILGIRDVREEETTVAGIHLYEQFLLGGEGVYYTKDEKINEKKQDMDLNFPWYTLASGTKIYMTGIMEDESVDYMDYPPVIWRNSFDSSFIFAVNGDYMEDVMGLGILSAMEAQTKDYTLYPIVNAQNLVIVNSPELADENETEMMRRYSRSMEHVLREIIWPDIISVYQRNGLGLSVMMSPQYDYADANEPKKDLLIYYMKLLNEQNAEIGLSGVCMSKTSVEEKLKADQDFMQKALPSYRFTSFYEGDLTEEEREKVLLEEILKNARTIVTDYRGDNEILGYVSENVTKQTMLTNGLTHTYREDFRTKCVETALGYSSVSVDLSDIMYPVGDDLNTWQDEAEDFSPNLYENWKSFRAFDGTSVSECDGRIRNFLSLDYDVLRKDDVISLSLADGGQSAWFILRTNGESIERVDGGEWEKIDKNAYLIKVEEENAAIVLNKTDLQYQFR